MSASQITSRLGQAVRVLRHRLGISQESLAERASLHRTYIARIETGASNITLKSVDKLAQALRVSTADLLSQAARRPDGSIPAVAGRPAGGCMDILMVEDNRDDAELTMRAFKQARIANPLQIVWDGQEALDFLFSAGRFANRTIEDQPGLILMDLKLPKVDGIEVLRQIKADERTRQIPVVVLTASRDSDELAECRRLGAAAHILKPVGFQGLTLITPELSLNWALLKPPETPAGGSGGLYHLGRGNVEDRIGGNVKPIE